MSITDSSHMQENPCFFHGNSYGENYVANINWVLSIEKVQGWKERSIDWMENLLLFVACRKCSIWTPPRKTQFVKFSIQKTLNNLDRIGCEKGERQLFSDWNECTCLKPFLYQKHALRNCSESRISVGGGKGTWFFYTEFRLPLRAIFFLT